MRGLGRGLATWGANNLLKKLIMNSIGRLRRGWRITLGYPTDTILLPVHGRVGGDAMKLVIGSKGNSLEVRPEKTTRTRGFDVKALRRTVTVQDLRGRGNGFKVRGTVDVAGQVEKTERLLFLLDLSMIAGVRLLTRNHGGEGSPN